MLSSSLIRLARVPLGQWSRTKKTVQGYKVSIKVQPRKSPFSALKVPRTVSRPYSIKPLLVENTFPVLNSDEKQPLELKLKKSERNLYVKWDDGCEAKLPAEFLRVESPSAEVQGHGGSHEKRLIFGRKFVNIIAIEPQGHYGVLLRFDDMHESGIYSWSYLRYLSKHKFSIMKRYIKNLRKAGKHRDPRMNVQSPRSQTPKTQL
jgi:DUF971 family protein